MWLCLQSCEKCSFIHQTSSVAAVQCFSNIISSQTLSQELSKYSVKQDFPFLKDNGGTGSMAVRLTEFEKRCTT